MHVFKLKRARGTCECEIAFAHEGLLYIVPCISVVLRRFTVSGTAESGDGVGDVRGLSMSCVSDEANSD